MMCLKQIVSIFLVFFKISATILKFVPFNENDLSPREVCERTGLQLASYADYLCNENNMTLDLPLCEASHCVYYFSRQFKHGLIKYEDEFTVTARSFQILRQNSHYNDSRSSKAVCRTSQAGNSFEEHCNCVKSFYLCDQDFCCSLDEKGDVWYGCPESGSIVSTYRDEDGTKRVWNCTNGGYFASPEPIATSEASCERMDSNCITMYGIVCDGAKGWLPCSEGFGFEESYCSDRKLNLVSRASCCEENKEMATKDKYGYTWYGCRNSETQKLVSCPADAPNFYERVSLNFSEPPTTNLSGCYRPCEVTCNAVYDDVLFLGCRGRNATVACSSCPNENITWFCGLDGNFLGKPYDNSCNMCWLNKAKELLRLNEPLTVVEYISNNTKTELDNVDQVIDIIEQTVDQFLAQHKQELSIEKFENFLNSYVNMLPNIGNVSAWSKLDNEKRKNSALTLITVTEKLAFLSLEALDGDVNNSSFTGESTDLKIWILYTSNISNDVEYHDRETSIQIMDNFNESNQTYSVVRVSYSSELGSAMFLNRKNDSINSHVLSFTLACYDAVAKKTEKIQPTQIRVTFSFANMPKGPSEKIIQRRLYPDEIPSNILGTEKCSTYRWFSEEHGTWIHEKSVASVSVGKVICDYSHLSILAVLMNLHSYEPDTTLESISTSLSIISIIALLITLIIFAGVKSIQSEQTFIGKHLCFCLLTGHLLILLALDNKFIYKTDDICAFLASVLHFAFLSAFFWMAIEGYLLFEKIIIVFKAKDQDMRATKAVLCAYGSAGLIIIVTAVGGIVSGSKAYGRPELCWLTQPVYIWTFIGPVLIIITGNLVVLGTALKKIVTRNADQRSVRKSNNNWIKGFLSLTITLGLTWMLGITYFDYNANDVVSYMFAILNGLQGLFIFIFRCVYNDDVRKSVAPYLARLRKYWSARKPLWTISYRASVASVDLTDSKSVIEKGFCKRDVDISIGCTKCEKFCDDQTSSLMCDVASVGSGSCVKSNLMPCEILQNTQKQRTEFSEAFLDKCIKNDNGDQNGGGLAGFSGVSELGDRSATPVIYTHGSAAVASPMRDVITDGFCVDRGENSISPVPPLYTVTIAGQCNNEMGQN